MKSVPVDKLPQIEYTVEQHATTDYPYTNVPFDLFAAKPVQPYAYHGKLYWPAHECTGLIHVNSHGWSVHGVLSQVAEGTTLSDADKNAKWYTALKHALAAHAGKESRWYHETV